MRQLALTVLAATAALALAAPAAATFPGANGLLVFASSRDGDSDLFVQRLDGSHLRKLVDRSGTDEFNPSWNRAGRAIVFQSGPTDGSDFDLYLVNADGTGARPLLAGATNDLRGQFCDGDTIVFQRNTAAVGDIYAIETNGTGLRRLTDDPVNDSTPTCSPDGTRVAFSSTRNGVQGIYEVPLASAQAARPTQLASPTLLETNAFDADYSADGATLAYVGPDPIDGSAEVFTKTLPSGTPTQVTHSPPPVQNRLPKFYPGGSALGHTRVNADGTRDLCLDSATCSSVARGADAVTVLRGADSGVVQPRLPCSCDSLFLDAKLAPALDEGRHVDVILEWTLRCIPSESGLGVCRGAFRLLDSPGVKKVKAIHQVVDGELRKVPKQARVFGCSGRCQSGVQTVGSLEFALTRGTVELDFVTLCNGERREWQLYMRVKKGRVKSFHFGEVAPRPG